MDKVIAAEWVKRLRSGDYKQGTRYLHRSNANEYCCLGILCEIAIEQKAIPPKKVVDSDTVSTYETPAGKFSGVIPDEVQAWAGMISNVGYLSNIRGKSLAELNDVEGYDFAHIADVIEQNVEVL